MKYNALVLANYYLPTTTSIGTKRFTGKFIIIDENQCPITITAAQFDRPIPVEIGDEIILDIYKKGPFYNILPKTSYSYEPFPVEKQEYYYKSTLDEHGVDEDDRLGDPKHPFANATIRRTSYIYNGVTLATLYKFVEINDNDIVHPEILNKCPDIPLPDDESGQLRLIEALRDYLPDEEHPNKVNYTPTEIFKYYKEVLEWRNKESTLVPLQYDSDRNHCICGHYIQELCYCEYMSPYGDGGIKKPPLGAIGNCCIKRMAYHTKLYARLLNDIIDNYKCGIFRTHRDISKKNGFGKVQMQFLQQCVLTKGEYEHLLSIIKSRTHEFLDNYTNRILYRISRFYVTHYDYVF